jgi:IclR family acetate operon transcriptional repressor
VHSLSAAGERQAGPQRPAGAARVLLVLKELGRHPHGASLDELSRAVGIPKSSVHRALAALRGAGLAERHGPGRYRLGLELVRLAFEYYEGCDERSLVAPVLEELVQRFAETAHFARLEGSEIVYVAKVEPAGRHARMSSRVGGRNPAHCTGLGKALLAYTLADAAEVERYVDEYGPLLRRTPRTLTSAAELAEDFERIRARGYALDSEESEDGIVCIAFPLFLASAAAPAGAVSVAAFAHRTPLSALEARAEEIRAVIRRHLGPVTP